MSGRAVAVQEALEPADEEPAAEAPVGDAGSDLSSIFEWLLALLNNLLATFSF